MKKMFVVFIVLGCYGVWSQTHLMAAELLPDQYPPDYVTDLTVDGIMIPYLTTFEDLFPEGTLEDYVDHSNSNRITIPPYAKYLEGLVIVLDPGHGGDAQKKRWKRGHTGFREAIANWNVALYLKALLESVSAEVHLTRIEDTGDVPDLSRARMANAINPDLFISIHHNAHNRSSANFTSTWYHGDINKTPSNLDLARYIQHEVSDALHIPESHLVKEVLYSDYYMFNNRGFGVLRELDGITACLLEASFFTNLEEEERLRDHDYNRREAYGIFLGLARYAWGGFPTSHLRAASAEPFDVSPEGGISWMPDPTAGCVIAASQLIKLSTPGWYQSMVVPVEHLAFEVNDGVRGRRGWGAQRNLVLWDSVAVRVDQVGVPHVRCGRNMVFVDLPQPLGTGQYRLDCLVQNLNKNHNLAKYMVLVVPESSENDEVTQHSVQP